MGKFNSSNSTAFNNRSSVIIIGGGLAGLISSLVLIRAGFQVTLIEKKQYPFHRVCGEYISNEVLPFFESLGISLQQFSPSKITKLSVTAVSGKAFSASLDLGGFGISRFTLDNYLYEKAKAAGVNFLTGFKANSIFFSDDKFEITLSDNQKLRADFAIGAFGKRSNLDKDRAFFQRRSPYSGIKYHVKTDFPPDLVQLDNFEGGYCGTVKADAGRYNICYLIKNEHLKRFGSIPETESEILFKNPHLKHLFSNADFLNEKPEVISEISFEQKTLVENHVLFCGDAAGMISPLCGNGMAMAIRSAKILSDTLIELQHASRTVLEQVYQNRWREAFANRLKTGRITQKFFGSKLISEIAITGLRNIKPLSNFIISKTHGLPF